MNKRKDGRQSLGKSVPAVTAGSPLLSVHREWRNLPSFRTHSHLDLIQVYTEGPFYFPLLNIDFLFSILQSSLFLRLLDFILDFPTYLIEI
jgi:hypothetical protein